MADIFENSYCTIAANITNALERGLFHPRPTTEAKSRFLTQILTNVQLTDSSWHGYPLSWYKHGHMRWWLDLAENGPLGMRGWCLQERYLSPRLLHILDDNLWLWECNSLTVASICYHQATSTPLHPMANVVVTCPVHKTIFSNIPDVDENIHDLTFYKRWHLLVQDYSTRELSFHTDKLPAISGMAHKVATLTGDTYLAGLWRKNIVRDLCWRPRRVDVRTPHRCQKYRAPSWSWAAIDGHVRFFFTDIYGEVKHHLEIIEVDMRPTTNDPMGQVGEGSRILVFGMLRRQTPSSSSNLYHNTYDDFDSQYPEVWCLWLASIYVPNRELGPLEEHHNLLMVPIGDLIDEEDGGPQSIMGAFRRVGTTTLHTGTDLDKLQYRYFYLV